jgi:hypothetical protein
LLLRPALQLLANRIKRHVHTTELYDVDGVKYLVLGGGGAEQDPILPGRTSIKVPANYPQELYWKGQAPKEEYNYVHVDVEPGEAASDKFPEGAYNPLLDPLSGSAHATCYL